MSDTSKNAYVIRLEKLEKLAADQAARIESLERVIAALGAVFTGGGAEVADDDELDSKFGDPIVKKDPTDRFWKGPGFVNKRMSECSPEYLDALAKYKDVCAKLKEKEGSESKRKYAEYDRKDAARARGWARRIRAGWKPPEKPAAPSFASNGGGARVGGGAFGGGGSSFGSRSSFGGGRGFGVSQAAPPPSPPSSGSIDDASDEDFEDSGTSFDFGANVEPTSDVDDEEELPL